MPSPLAAALAIVRGRSAMDCDVLVHVCFSLSLSLSLALSLIYVADLIVFGLKGRGDGRHCTCMAQGVRYVVRPPLDKIACATK